MTDLAVRARETDPVDAGAGGVGRGRSAVLSLLVMADVTLGLDLENLRADGRRRPRERAAWSRRRKAAVGVGLLWFCVLGTVAATHASAVEALGTGALVWGQAAVTALSWQAVVCLIAVSLLHHVAAAVSARAAAGVRMPFGELVAAQFAAAAANRLTPAGLGGATLLGRYFSRRGHLRGPAAAAAVSSLAVAGAVADIAAFGALIGVGTLLGIAGARSEVPLLVARITALVPVSGTGGWWLAAAVATSAAVTTRILLSRSGNVATRMRGAGSTFAVALRGLMARPGRMVVMMTTSASTTLLLAVGFAAAATLSATGLPLVTFFALVVGYMVAAAAGNAVPMPGGVGAVDAALAGVLLAAGVNAAAAVGIVLAFRLITFWSPALVGMALVAPLRRRGAF